MPTALRPGTPGGLFRMLLSKTAVREHVGLLVVPSRPHCYCQVARRKFASRRFELEQLNVMTGVSDVYGDYTAGERSDSDAGGTFP